MIRLVLIVIVLFAGGVGGLYYYGSKMKPNPAPVEKVVPNERFPQ